MRIVPGRRKLEPPTFRFSEGFARPGGSITGRLIGPYDVLVPSEVQDQPHVSTAVVSKIGQIARAVLVGGPAGGSLACPG